MVDEKNSIKWINIVIIHCLKRESVIIRYIHSIVWLKGESIKWKDTHGSIFLISWDPPAKLCYISVLNGTMNRKRKMIGKVGKTGESIKITEIDIEWSGKTKKWK